MKPPNKSHNYADAAVTWLLKPRDRRRTSEVRLRARVVMGGMLLLTIMILHKITAQLLDESHLDVLLPSAMTYLSAADWVNVAITGLASLCTFAVTLLLSYTLGLLASLSSTAFSVTARIAGLSVDTIYRFLYIVPVVLTVSMVFTLAQGLFLQYEAFPAVGLVGLTMTFSGLCIAGYPVYYTVYSAILEPDRRHVLLVDTVYNAPSRTLLIFPVPSRLARAFRLVDGNVRGLCDSVERAWHLTIVAVVIVESIIPGIYGMLGASSQIKGIGRSVVEIQSVAGSYRVMGYMWSLFIFDLVFLVLIRHFLRRRFMRHYREE